MTPAELQAKWEARLAKVRAELEAAAAAGDETAQRILADVAGEPMTKRVNAPIPGPPAIPKPWCEPKDEEGDR